MKALQAIFAVTVSLAMGCQSVSDKKSAPTPDEMVQPTVDGGEDRVVKPSKARIVNKLLRQAETAMSRNRLTAPLEDNAYDRYRAALMLEPENEAAKRGLESISETYVAKVMEWAERKKWAQTQMALEDLKAYFPNHPKLPTLDKAVSDLKAAERDLQRERDRAEPVLETLSLDTGALDDRSQTAVQILKDVALRIQGSDESVLIYARTDAEGRWIYKTMKEQVEGYRIRGDIRISREPAIKFLPPL